MNFTGKRYFAYIDILGFKKLCQAKNPQIQPSEVLYNFVSSSWINKEYDNSDFGILYFSDTIILYYKHEAIDHIYLRDICALARGIVNSMLCKGIPIRGVVNYGELNIQNYRGVETFWGKGLIESHKAESTQNIVGLFALPNSFEGYQGMLHHFSCNGSLMETDFYVDECKEIYINLFPYLSSLDQYNLDMRDYDRTLCSGELKAYSFLKSQASNNALL